jgi:hypothetical protein
VRRFRPDDLETLARWQADPRFIRHMGRGQMTRAESVQSLERYEAHWREHGFGHRKRATRSATSPCSSTCSTLPGRILRASRQVVYPRAFSCLATGP